MFSGEVIKAEIIINHDLTAGSCGPKARILTRTGQVWWVYEARDGMLEMSLRDTLSLAATESEVMPVAEGHPTVDTPPQSAPSPAGATEYWRAEWKRVLIQYMSEGAVEAILALAEANGLFELTQNEKRRP